MRGILLLGLAWLAPITAHAASFDCDKAKTRVEHIVCDHGRISALDTRLATRYRAALSALSPEGRKLLRAGQRRWLRYLNQACVEYNTSTEDYALPAQCVRELYRARLEDMRTAAVKIGPFLFSRIDYFYAKKRKGHARAYRGETAYPRIDNPMNDTARAWNAKMAKWKSAAGDNICGDGIPGEVNNIFKITSATQTAISVQTKADIDCDISSRTAEDYQDVTYILAPRLRLLKAADLFAADKPWQAFLARKVLHALEQDDTDAARDADAKALVEIVSTPKSWALSTKGLVITIDPEEVLLPYAGGTVDVRVPWRELRPFMASSRFIPRQGNRPVR